MHERARRIVPIVVIAVVVLGIAAWYVTRPAEAGAASSSGTVEATTVAIAPELAGRVSEVLVEEGDVVKAGDPLIRLDGASLAAQRDQAAAAAEAGRAAAQAARAELALLEAGPSAQQVAVAQAAVDGAQVAADALHDQYADLSRAAKDSTAGRQLKSRRDQAAAGVRQARAQLALVRAGARPEQVEAARARVDAATAQAAAAEATLAALDVQLGKLTLVSPTDGVVLTRAVEPGAYAAPGGALLQVGDLADLTITVYVPEDRYGALTLGQAATVTTDSFPGETFAATIVRIADQAEFTPRNVQTPDGRRATVYAVRLAIDDPAGRLKPGMPADVAFS